MDRFLFSFLDHEYSEFLAFLISKEKQLTAQDLYKHSTSDFLQFFLLQKLILCLEGKFTIFFILFLIKERKCLYFTS